MKRIVYGLSDNGQIRYIGKSSFGLKRPKEHTQPSALGREAHTHKTRWLRSVIDAGRTPEVLILEVCASHEALDAAERKWIAEGRSRGWKLTNMTDGGEGLVGYRHTAASRSKISETHKGKKRPLSWRKNLSASQRGKVIPEASRLKMSAAKKGKTLPAEWAMNIARAMLGRRHSDATRVKQSEARRRYARTPAGRAQIARNLEAANAARRKAPTQRRMKRP